MPRQRILWFAISLLILSSLACNAFASAPEPGLTLPPPPVTEAETTTLPDGIMGLAPTATLPGALTDTPLVDAAGNPLLEALIDVNVRTGPGVIYGRDGFLLAGETAAVLGRDPVSGWWKIDCPGRSDGTECWVSGGAQYTKVTNGGGVPVAAVPPTPTPKPSPTPAGEPDSEPRVTANPLLVYVDDAGLWLVTLDVSQNPPAGSNPIQLIAGPDVEMPLIAPDGRKIAYRTSTPETNAVHVINIDGSDNRILFSSADLEVIVETDTAVLLDQIQWLNDSQGLAFNTQMVNLIGPGQASREDLWTIGLDGALANPLDAGLGGGSFAISRNNQVIFGQDEGIVRANLDGSRVETIIAFGFINTASEYVYYPRPQWTADFTQAFVAIPSADPWGPDADVALWRIPVNGAAEALETLPGNTLFNPVVWSPNGNRLARVFQVADGSSPPVLNILDGDGLNPRAYDSGEQIAFHDWNADEIHFLYAGSRFYAVGQIGAPPTRFEAVGGTAVMQWLTPSSFVVVNGGDGVWSLIVSNVDGDADLLAAANTNFVQVDVWRP